jgi:hypothetical protein
MSIENFDFGPVFSTLVKPSRRNSFACVEEEPTLDEMIYQGYTAYGFDDNKFKYGLWGNGWSIRKSESYYRRK